MTYHTVLRDAPYLHTTIIHTNTNAHTYIRTHTHIHTHTHTHTYSRIHIPLGKSHPVEEAG